MNWIFKGHPWQYSRNLNTVMKYAQFPLTLNSCARIHKRKLLFITILDLYNKHSVYTLIFERNVTCILDSWILFFQADPLEVVQGRVPERIFLEFCMCI